MRLWEFSFSSPVDRCAESDRVEAAPGIALTIGNFDGMHLGHRRLLADLQCKAQARGLGTAVLTFEPHPREFLFPKSAPPRLSSLRDKLSLLQKSGIDRVYVVRFDHELAHLEASDFVQRALVERIRPRHLLIGDDFQFGRQRQGNIHLLRSMGEKNGWDIAAMATHRFDGERVSSTRVREALQLGDVDLAERLLGWRYCIGARLMRAPMQTKTPAGLIYLQLDQPTIPLWGDHMVTLFGFDGKAISGLARITPRGVSQTTVKPLIAVRLDDAVAMPWHPGQRLMVHFQQRHQQECAIPSALQG